MNIMVKTCPRYVLAWRSPYPTVDIVTYEKHHRQCEILLQLKKISILCKSHHLWVAENLYRSDSLHQPPWVVNVTVTLVMQWSDDSGETRASKKAKICYFSRSFSKTFKGAVKQFSITKGCFKIFMSRTRLTLSVDFPRKHEWFQWKSQ